MIPPSPAPSASRACFGADLSNAKENQFGPFLFGLVSSRRSERCMGEAWSCLEAPCAKIGATTLCPLRPYRRDVAKGPLPQWRTMPGDESCEGGAYREGSCPEVRCQPLLARDETDWFPDCSEWHWLINCGRRKWRDAVASPCGVMLTDLASPARRAY